MPNQRHEELTKNKNKQKKQTEGKINQSFPGGSHGKESACNPGSIPGLEDPLEKEMATHPVFQARDI